MSLTLVTPPVGLENGYPIWYPSRCKFCICFTDGDLIAETGTHSELVLQMTVNASNGDYFILGGQDFFFKTVPADDFDILIGATTTDTITNTAAILKTFQTFNPSDYLITTFGNKVTIHGQSLAMTLPVIDLGSSTLTVFSSTALVVPALISDDYRVYVELLFRPTTSLVNLDIERGLELVPLISEDVIFLQWSYGMCLPIDAFILARVVNHVPDATAIPTPSYAIRYDWMVDFKVRFARHYGGVTYAFSESAYYTSTNATCPDSGDYEAYSQDIPHNDGELFMLVKRNGLEYCSDVVPFFYLAIKQGEEVFVSVEWNDGSGWVGAASAYITPGKDAILEVRPSNLYPANFVGQVRFWVENTSHNETTEVVNFRLVGGACCTQSLYFLNRFGKYELIQIGRDTKTGIEIDVSRYTTCDTCSEASNSIDYSVQFSEVHLGWTGKLRLNDTEDMSFVRDFFTSPEVWLLNEFNEMERVTVERGTVGLRDNAAQTSVRFQVKYSKAARRS